MLLTKISEIAEQVKELYPIPQNTVLHTTINLIISQKIRFSSGRQIRQNVYQLINSKSDHGDHDQILRECTYDEWKTCGVPKAKIDTILEVCKVSPLTFESLAKIKGVGPWTIKALMIMTGTGTSAGRENVLLSEDLYIRKRISELCGLTSVLSSKDVENISKKYCWTNLTQVSKFFWRIKPEGITTLLDGKELTRDHFV